MSAGLLLKVAGFYAEIWLQGRGVYISVVVCEYFLWATPFPWLFISFSPSSCAHRMVNNSSNNGPFPAFFDSALQLCNHWPECSVTFWAGS